MSPVLRGMDVGDPRQGRNDAHPRKRVVCLGTGGAVPPSARLVPSTPGRVRYLTEHVIESMAKQSLRTLGLAYRWEVPASWHSRPPSPLAHMCARSPESSEWHDSTPPASVQVDADTRSRDSCTIWTCVAACMDRDFGSRSELPASWMQDPDQWREMDPSLEEVRQATDPCCKALSASPSATLSGLCSWVCCDVLCHLSSTWCSTVCWASRIPCGLT